MEDFLKRLAGLGSAALVSRWMSTLEYKAAYYDPTVDPTNPGCEGQKFYIFWHEYILFPLYLRGHCNLTMLLSMHRDADVLVHTAHHMGFAVTRGSSTRGGVKAARELMRASQRMNLCTAPDGPIGPRRQLAQGPIYLASRLGLPLVVMGLGYDRPWRANTWDRFALPRYGSRARAVVSPQLHIPADLDRHGLEEYRLRAEALLNRLTLEAEAWAESGTAKIGEVPIRREPAARQIPLVSRLPESGPQEMRHFRLPPAA